MPDVDAKLQHDEIKIGSDYLSVIALGVRCRAVDGWLKLES